MSRRCPYDYDGLIEERSADGTYDPGQCVRCVVMWVHIVQNCTISPQCMTGISLLSLRGSSITSVTTILLQNNDISG